MIALLAWNSNALDPGVKVLVLTMLYDDFSREDRMRMLPGSHQ
jgi:hypothetical protein